MICKLSHSEIMQIFEIFRQYLPTPKTELIYSNNYTLLVAVMLSAQATDISVNKATKNLFEIISEPIDMINLGLDKLEQHIKAIGLYKGKSRNIIDTSTILYQKYNSQVPDNFDDLISLPGVGRKTANVVLNCAFDHATIAVDTHVFRVANRIGLADSNNIVTVEKQLLEMIPECYKIYAHHWLILHGRYICTARKVKCNECSISHICYYNRLNSCKV